MKLNYKVFFSDVQYADIKMEVTKQPKIPRKFVKLVILKKLRHSVRLFITHDIQLIDYEYD